MSWGQVMRYQPPEADKCVCMIPGYVDIMLRSTPEFRCHHCRATWRKDTSNTQLTSTPQEMNYV